MHICVCSNIRFFQDECTWTDGSPYIYSYWMPEYLKNNSLEYQVFEDEHLIYNYTTSIDRRYFISNNTHLVHCVAFGLLPDGSLSHWIPISCNISYQTSFFCVSNTKPENYVKNTEYMQRPADLHFGNKKQQPYNTTTTNITYLVCPDGWIMIQNDCFYAYTVASRVTFLEAEAICNTVEANLPVISKPYLGQSISYQSSKNYTVIPPKIPYSEILDQFNDENNLKLLDKFATYDTKYQEMMYGFRLMAVDENKNIASLLEILGNFITFLSTSMFRGPRGECFTLEFDERLSNMLPDIHTIYGHSVPGWVMVKRKCSAKQYALPLLCTKAAASTNMECAPNQYRCRDGSCILDIYRCDTFGDCMMSEDEKNCSQTNPQLISCFSSDEHYSQTMIPFHSLCDGITHCPNGTDEAFCLYNHVAYYIQDSEQSPDKYRNFENQKLLEKPPFAKMDHDINYVNTIFTSRLSYYLDADHPNQLNSSVYLLYNWRPFYLQCSLVNNAFLFEDLCKHRARPNKDTPCGMGAHLQHCQHVICSGMFKCGNSFCIEIENICDGIQDCICGDDEMSCFNLSCPGMLKCRGLTRCVPPWKLCDGYIHCEITMDDEMGCKRCPEHCKCDNRALACETSVTLKKKMHENKTVNKSQYTVIRDDQIISYSQTTLMYLVVTDLKVTSDNSETECMIYNILNPYLINIKRFDISQCHLRTADNINFMHYAQIEFLNASHNSFFTIRFLTTIRDLPLRDLDLSYNKIIRIESPQLFNLKCLEILRFRSNKINHLETQFLRGASHLKMLDIRQNPIHYISSRLVTLLKYMSVLNVSDKEICCIFPGKVKCYVSLDTQVIRLNIQNCLEYSANNIVKLVIQFMFTACIFSNISSFIFNITHMKVKKTRMVVSFLNLNISLSGLISIFYVISFFFVNLNSNGISEVHTNASSVDISCISKQLCCLITLQMDIYLLITKSYTILCRIKYPFRHQCIWIKFTNVICILVWIISIGNGAILIDIHYSELNIASFSNNCNILAESKHNGFLVKLISFFVSILYVVVILTYIHITFNFYFIVRQSISAVTHSKSDSEVTNIITRNTICIALVESFLLLAVSVTILIPCIVLFQRNLYGNVLTFIFTLKTLLNDMIHTLCPAFSRLYQSRQRI